MTERRGEKAGWIAGWTGGFLWLVVLSLVWLYQGRVATGLLGIALVAAAMAAVLALAPWKRPDTPYWKLMIPLHTLLFLGVALTLVHYWPLPEMMNVNPVSWLWMIVLFIPFGTMGKRTWNDK